MRDETISKFFKIMERLMPVLIFGFLIVLFGKFLSQHMTGVYTFAFYFFGSLSLLIVFGLICRLIKSRARYGTVLLYLLSVSIATALLLRFIQPRMGHDPYELISGSVSGRSWSALIVLVSLVLGVSVAIVKRALDPTLDIRDLLLLLIISPISAAVILFVLYGIILLASVYGWYVLLAPLGPALVLLFMKSFKASGGGTHPAARRYIMYTLKSMWLVAVLRMAVLALFALPIVWNADGGLLMWVSLLFGLYFVLETLVIYFHMRDVRRVVGLIRNA